jgi:hypothetical protein
MANAEGKYWAKNLAERLCFRKVFVFVKYKSTCKLNLQNSFMM